MQDIRDRVVERILAELGGGAGGGLPDPGRVRDLIHAEGPSIEAFRNLPPDVFAGEAGREAAPGRPDSARLPGSYRRMSSPGQITLCMANLKHFAVALLRETDPGLEPPRDVPFVAALVVEKTGQYEMFHFVADVLGALLTPRPGFDVAIEEPLAVAFSHHMVRGCRRGRGRLRGMSGAGFVAVPGAAHVYGGWPHAGWVDSSNGSCSRTGLPSTSASFRSARSGRFRSTIDYPLYLPPRGGQVPERGGRAGPGLSRRRLGGRATRGSCATFPGRAILDGHSLRQRARSGTLVTGRARRSRRRRGSRCSGRRRDGRCRDSRGHRRRSCRWRRRLPHFRSLRPPRTRFRRGSGSI